ncbi:MAG: glycoside hydrolase family 13 protein [Clostridia bacterium]|nr:glycoside hydrolase family 13 protein [Clostridia bacterium]
MASFIKGTKIWNRIEKKFLITDHGEAETGLCGAFTLDSTVRFTLEAMSATCVKMVIFADADGKKKEFEMSKSEGGGFFLELPMNKISKKSGLFFYEYLLKNAHGEFFVVRDNADFSDKIIDKEPQGDERFQLLIYEPREVYPEFFRGGIAYQIFPDRFFRGGHEELKADAKINPDWYHGTPEYFRPGDKNFKNNVFFGGDLPGIEQKLKYIASLGVTAIYLNPIFLSSSTHKYDTADYTKIDPMFGGEEAFRSLIKAAKKYKISIILDGVFNHTGDDSVYFNKYGKYDGLGAYQSKESPYAEWFNFTEFPEEYESWWGFKNLPRVMSDNPSYKKFLFGKDGVVRKYIREGICGWRLDVADELSDEFLEELSAAARAEREDALIIGEVWEDASNKVSYGKRRSYFSGKELDSVMNYPVREAILAYVRHGDMWKFMRTVNSLYYNYPREMTHQLLNLLGTHDTVRAITALAGAGSEGLSVDMLAAKRMTQDEYRLGIKRMKLAYFILATVPGVPCIYYGDEIGMQGEKDPFNRMPYPWGQENHELLRYFRKVGRMRRRESDFFADAEFELMYIDRSILVFERKKGEEILVSVVNRSKDVFAFSADDEVNEIFYQRTGMEFEVKGMSAYCFKMNKDTKYGVVPRLKK